MTGSTTPRRIARTTRIPRIPAHARPNSPNRRSERSDMQFLKAGLLFLVVMRITMSARRLSSGDFAGFSWQAQPMAARFWRAKRKIKGLTLRIPIPDKLRFVLRGETGLDRFARGLGIASEWQTGDTAFDQKVFI